jgi:hypothetical protein
MLGALAIDVNAGELLPVVIVNGHLPVMMFAAPVTVEGGGPFLLSFDHEISPQSAGVGTIAALPRARKFKPGNNITVSAWRASSIRCGKTEPQVSGKSIQ